MHHTTPPQRLPDWFKVRLSTNEQYAAVRGRIRKGHLHTVCESAACPNRNECWNAGTATFLILGAVCTRGCGFCNIPRGQPRAADSSEPRRVADAVAALGLSYAVVTSVTRDDLPDGGAGLFAETIRAIRRRLSRCRVEVLIPDFQGSLLSLQTVFEAEPDVLNHNIETVPSLYARVRPQADYVRSMRLLAAAKERGFVTKSGLMLGLGEGMDEVRSVLRDLRSAGCDLLTIGQYLRPHHQALPVAAYYHPDEFTALRAEALAMGFRGVSAGPRVRSSYHAQLVAGHQQTGSWKGQDNQ
jgi:lipoic acid synthetase